MVGALLEAVTTVIFTPLLSAVCLTFCPTLSCRRFVWAKVSSVFAFSDGVV